MPCIQIYGCRALTHTKLIHCNCRIIYQFNPADNPSGGAFKSSDAASGVPAASPIPAASAAPSGAAAKPSDFWQGKVLAPYSGDELVYNATLGDWRTHNGVDAAAAAGDEVPAVKGGRSVVRWRSLMQPAAPGGIAGLHPAVLWAAMWPPGM